MKKLGKLLALILATTLIGTMFTACGPEVSLESYKKEVAATYGDEDISLAEANFFLRYAQAQMEQYYWNTYTQYGYKTPWEAPANKEGTKTMEVIVKEQIMQQLHQTRVLCDHAADYEIELTDDETAKCETKAAQMIADFSDDFLAKAPVDEEVLTSWLQKNMIANKVHQAFIDAAEVEVTDAESQVYTVKYVFFNEVETDDSTSTTGAPAEATLDKTTEAEEFYNALSDGADIVELAKEKSVTDSEQHFLIDDEAYTASLDEGAEPDEMRVQTKDIAEGAVVKYHVDDKGWYVVQKTTSLDDEATQTKVGSVKETKKEEAFNETYKQWQEEAPSFSVKAVFEDLVMSDGVQLKMEKETEGAEGGEGVEEYDGSMEEMIENYAEDVTPTEEAESTEEPK